MGAGEWLRTCLDRQIPRPRFPAGAAVPSRMCALALVLLAVATVLLLAGPTRPEVPAAVVESQLHTTRLVAAGVRATAATELQALTSAAENYGRPGAARDADRLVRSVVGASGWRGATVLNGAVPIAANGKPVQPGVVAMRPSTAGLTTVRDAAGVHLVGFAPLADGRTLTATMPLRTRLAWIDADHGQSLVFAPRNGGWAVAQGAPVSAEDPVLAPLVARAVAAGLRDGTPAAGAETSRGGTAVSGAGGDAPATVITAVSAGESGLTVVSVVRQPQVPPGSPWRGLPLGLGLLGVAALVLVLGHAAIVRPLRRLLAHLSAAAVGGSGTHAPRWRVDEVARIAAGLRRLRTPGRGTRPGLAPPVWLVAVLCAAAPIGWAVVAVAPGAGDRAPVPAQVAVDLRNQVDIVGRSVQLALDGGLGQVTAATAGEPEGLRSRLDALATDDRFRSVYQVDAAGRLTNRAGRPPLRPEGAVPAGSGVRVDDRVRRVPTIYAYSALPGGGGVVAEFDIRHLSGLLGRADGRLRLVDQRFRTWVDTEGYQAFATVRGSEARAAGAGAFAGRPPQSSSARSLVTAVALDRESPTEHLGLAVIAELPAADLDLWEHRDDRRRLLVALVAVAVALIGLGWHLFLVALPLRRVARAAERLAAGDTGTPIEAARQDEVGAIAMCLEICRQVATDGPERLGGAARMRGSTVEVAVIPGPRRAENALPVGS
ncbi:HAMP domain-containing protein [Longispora sp. K20-0274]|uniref:HAMP domain-containing protein n=1 Tax=Longispora sp. K20-0274 TaxID=3088255 RepID=UPI00399A8598